MGIDAVRRIDAEHLRPERVVEQHQLRRHQPGPEDLLIVIDVVEKGVDRLHPLDGAPLDQIPLGAVDNAGDKVEGNQPLGRTAFAIDRKGDAEPAENLLGGLLLVDEGVDGEAVEQLGKAAKAGRTLPVSSRISSKNLRVSREDSSVPASTLALSTVCGNRARPSSSKNDTLPSLARFPCLIFRHLNPMPAC